MEKRNQKLNEELRHDRFSCKMMNLHIPQQIT
jgi:hypothetical protein